MFCRHSRFGLFWVYPILDPQECWLRTWDENLSRSLAPVFVFLYCESVGNSTLQKCSFCFPFPFSCTAELAVLLGRVSVRLTALGPCRMCLFSSERRLHCYSPARVADVLQSSLSLSSCSVPGFSTSRVRNQQTTPEGKMSFQKVGLTSVSFLSQGSGSSNPDCSATLLLLQQMFSDFIWLF